MCWRLECQDGRPKQEINNTSLPGIQAVAQSTGDTAHSGYGVSQSSADASKNAFSGQDHRRSRQTVYRGIPRPARHLEPT